MASPNAAPITGRELIRVLQGGVAVWISHSQFATLMTVTGKATTRRPFSVPTTLLGSETFEALQDGNRITMSAADIATFLAGSGTAPIDPDPQETLPFSGYERVIGYQGGVRVAFSVDEASAILATNILPPVYVTRDAATLALGNAQTTLGTAPRNGQQYAYDKFIKRIRASGIISAADPAKHGIWIADQTSGAKITNLLNPGVHDMVQVGSPTYTPNVGFTSAASANYYDSGIAFSLMDQNTHTLASFVKAPGNALSNYDLGIANGTTAGTAQGYGLMVRDTNNQYRFRSAGTEVVAGTSGQAPGKGFSAMVRRDASNVEIWRDDQLLTTVSNASAAITTGTLTNTLVWGRTSGVLGVSGRIQGFSCYLPTLTAAQMAVLANAVRDLMEAIEFGAVDMREKLVSGNETLTFDTVIFGDNIASLMDAVQSKRSGLSVAIVMPHRAVTLGGVVTGGLGATDITVPSGADATFKNMLNGLPRDVITAAGTIYNAEYGTSRTDTIAMFEPRIFSRALRQVAVANGIPVYFSDGISSVQTSGLRITSFTTYDGRTYAAGDFSDHSVEGDLIAKSGLITFRIGREAAGTGNEQYSGYRGFSTAGGATSSQVQGTVNGFLNGTDASAGYIQTVKPAPATAIGTATSDVQDFNFRIIVTNIATRLIPFFPAGSSAPPGYDRGYYDHLDRQFVAKNTLTLSDVFITTPNLLAGSTASGVFDWNNANGVGFSTDMPGSGTAFSQATTEAARDAIVLDIFRKHVLGLFWYLGYDTNTNVPSAVRTSFLTYGWDAWHFPIAVGPAGAHQSNQVYVRELRRISGMMTWDANDAALADTSTPRSQRTAAHAFYACDHHAVQTIANTTTGAIWREGISNIAGTGGADGVAPIFLEAFLPQPSQCLNLVTANSPSMTVDGYGAYRMEFSMGMAGQALGALKAIRKRQSLNGVQNVAYSDIVTELSNAPDTTKVAYVQNNPALGAPA